jgi:hypothetical protein
LKRLLKNRTLKLKIQSNLKESLVEGISVVSFFGAIHFSPLIRANLAALKIGGLIN